MTELCYVTRWNRNLGYMNSFQLGLIFVGRVPRELVTVSGPFYILAGSNLLLGRGVNAVQTSNSWNDADDGHAVTFCAIIAQITMIFYTSAYATDTSLPIARQSVVSAGHDDGVIKLLNGE